MCKQVVPEFSRAASLAATKLPGLRFGSVNSDEHPDLASSLGVTSFPRFFLYRNGESEIFPLVPSGEAFLAGAARMLGVENADSFSPAKEFSEEEGAVENFAKWLFWRGKEGGRLDTTLVLFSPQNTGCQAALDVSEGQRRDATDTCSAKPLSMDLERAFNEAAGELLKDPSVRFARVSSTSIVADFELPPDRPTLVMYKDHDEGRAEYSGEASLEGIVSWAKVQNTPLVTFVTHKTIGRVRKGPIKLALLFLEEAQTEHPATLSKTLEALRGIVYELEAEGALKRGEFTLGVTNGKKYSSWVVETYGLPKGTLPALAGEDIASETTYVMEDVGGAWAKEALCSSSAVSQVGLLGKWRIVVSHMCSNELREASVVKVRRAMQEEGALQSEIEELLVDSIAPEKTFPLALTVAALDLPLSPIKDWIRSFVLNKLAPKWK